MDPLEKFMHMIEQLEDPDYSPPLVAVIGSYNAGKSTLINTMLGEKICPGGPLPTTTSLLFIKYGSKFSARAEGNGKSLCFPSKKMFLSFLQNRKTAFDKIEITLPHPFLQKCTLVDTPGIDPARGSSPELTAQLAMQADKIVYLFHQRGIDEINKNYIKRICTQASKGYRAISFWINCNLGPSDGTSLKNTQQILQALLGWSPRLHLVNTRSSTSARVLRNFLEVELAKDAVSRLNARYKLVDEKIPARLLKCSTIQDDLLFLDTFWSVKEDAEKILQARDILNKLPQVESRLQQMLREAQKIFIQPGLSAERARDEGGKVLGIPEIKAMMDNLARKIMHDPTVKSILPPRDVGKWAGILQKEEFKVVAVGGFSSGKSTFFNAIMGEKILPAENRPTTSNITYIRHGAEKKASVTFKNKVTLSFYQLDGNTVEIKRENIAAVQHWLDHSTGKNKIIEAYIDYGKGRVKINLGELAEEIKRTKEIFSNKFRSGVFDKRRPSSLFRPLPVWKTVLNNLVKEVSLVFAPTPPAAFDLNNPVAKTNFQNLVTSLDALCVEQIDITHPAEFLQAATFVDTPGLDATGTNQGVLTTDFLQHSDAFLFFLNGKHVLNKSDAETLLGLFRVRLKDYLRSVEPEEATRELGKFFFIVNFGDTLGRIDQEKIRTHLKNSINHTLNEIGITAANTQIAIISPLKVLQGEKMRSFEDLLAAIGHAVWVSRGHDFLQEHLAKLKNLVKTAKYGQHLSPASHLPKYSASSILLPGVKGVEKDIRDKFSLAYRVVGQLKNRDQFLTFIHGPSRQKEQEVTQISDFNFFRWGISCNRKVKRQLDSLQKEIYRSAAMWLHSFHCCTNPHSLPPSPPGISLAGATAKMEDIVETSRTFYGGFKAGLARQKIDELLKKLESELIQDVEKWLRDTEKYVQELVTPAVIAVGKNYITGNIRRRHTTAKHQAKLAGFLEEINYIQQLLDNPGGFKDGKRKGTQ